MRKALIFDFGLDQINSKPVLSHDFQDPNKYSYSLESCFKDGDLISEKCWDEDGNERVCN